MLFPYADDNPTERAPLLTLLIIGVNVFVFFFLTAPNYEFVVKNFGFTPSRFSLLTLFTSMFLHAGVLHLVFNMWFLWLFGANVEDKLGRLFFLGFYLFGGVLASLAHALFASEQMRLIPCIGASGAVSAVMAAYLVFFPKARIRTLFSIGFYFFRSITMSAFIWIGFWFLGQLFYSYIALFTQTSRVAYGAHIGGFIFGLAFSFLVKRLIQGFKSDSLVTLKSQEKREFFEEVINTKLSRDFSKKESFSDYSQEIETYLEKGPEDKALSLYAELEAKGLPGVLGLKNQKRIAGLLIQKNKPEVAFGALIRLILNYQNTSWAAEAECRAGLLCAKEFNNHSEAINYLKKGLSQKENISDFKLIREAEAELAAINKKLELTFVKIKEADPKEREFAIIAQLIQEELLDSEKICRTLFKVKQVGGSNLGYQLAACARQNLRVKDGLIMQNLNSIQATIAAYKLQKINIPVLVIPQSQVLNYQSVVCVDRVEFSGDCLILEKESTIFTLRKSDINYIIMGQIPYLLQTADKKETGLFYLKGTISARKDLLVKEMSVNQLIDIFTLDKKRFRIRLLKKKDGEDESLIQRDFKALLGKLAQFAGGKRLDQKMQVFISANLWQGLVFKDIREFDQKALWAIRLKHAYTYLT